MRYENPRPPYPNELYHHGVLGMHWGIRRYQPYPKGYKAERKRLKAEYKDSKKNVENTAYQVRMARTNAVKAEKKYAKSSVKNANERSAKAIDARRTKEFWEKEYANALKTYRKKANAAGKKVKYDGSNHSTVVASTNAGSKGLYALFGGLGGLANVAKLNSMARNIEESKGFNRNLNQQSQKNYKANQKAINRRLNDLQFAERIARQTGDLNSLRSIQNEISKVKAQKAGGARHNNAVNYLVRYGIPKATAKKVVKGKDADSLADMMKDAYKNPALLTNGANRLSASELERHLYG